MDKRKLRKLGVIYANKELYVKACDNRIDESVNRGGCVPVHYNRRYGILIRAKKLSEYVKIAVFIPAELAAGRNKPRFEIFIDTAKRQFITRQYGKNEEEIWRQACVDNIFGYGSDEYTAIGSYNKYIRNPSYSTKDTATLLISELGVSDGGYYGILEYQHSIRKDTLEEKRRRETAPWDEDMALIPDEPEGFTRWWQKEAIPEHYIFYTYRRHVKTGWCSYCEQEVALTEKPKLRKEGTCPTCGTAITYMPTGRFKTLATSRYDVALIQPLEDAYVVRGYTVEKHYDSADYMNPRYIKRETIRTLYMDRIKEYAYQSYKNTCMRWVEVGGAYYWWDRERIYPGNMDEIQKCLPRSGLPSLIKWGIKVGVNYWLRKEKAVPALELIVKAGLPTLAVEISRYNPDGILGEDTELTKILKIDRARLTRLKSLHDLTALLWLQDEKAHDTIYPDEVIRFFNTENITPKDLNFIRPHMTPVAIMNYLKKQQSVHSMARTIGTWRDYMNMASRLKMPLNKEQIYRPKDLKAAHDEAVEFLEARKQKEQAEERLRQYPHVNEVCRELVKYEWQQGDYAVVAPKDAEDIIREGTILHHCIHTCDFYFDRMNRRETYLLFLRKTSDIEAPWYTMEVEPSGNIRQKRTTGDNQNKDLPVEFLAKWQKEIQKRLTKKDRELAKMSEGARIEGYRKLREDGNKVWHGKMQGRLLADVLEEDFMAAEEAIEALIDKEAG